MGSGLTPGIIGRLAEEFELDAHQELARRGTKITFVHWSEYVRRLNEVDPNWTMETEEIQFGDKLVVKVKLTVCGATRVNYGDEDVEEDGYGTAITNAMAQALKRAAAMFELGLYMYDKRRTADIRQRKAEAGNGARRPEPRPTKAAAGRAAKAAAPTEEAGEGWRSVQVMVSRGRWQDMLSWLCTKTDHYLTTAGVDKGKVNEYHVLSAVSKLGVTEINDTNYKRVLIGLIERLAEEEDADLLDGVSLDGVDEVEY